jgi:site-specific DNA-methyltransferase (adenine-specific)
MDTLRALPNDAADSVVSDPPYGISYQNKMAEKRRELIINDRRPFIWWLHDASRILRPGGALVCFCRWDVQEDFRRSIELAGLARSR